MRAFHTARAGLDCVFHIALAPPEASAGGLERRRFRLKRPQPTHSGLRSCQTPFSPSPLPAKHDERGHKREYQGHHEDVMADQEPLGWNTLTSAATARSLRTCFTWAAASS